jgi:hypothetical protein
MIDSTRRELLAQIEALSALCPEYRLGQMILNLAFLEREDGDQRLWDVEDGELIAAARKHLADWGTPRGETTQAGQPDPVPAKI